MAKRRSPQPAEPGFGFWDRPALINLVADLLIVAAVAGLTWAAALLVQRLPVFPLRQVIVTRPLVQVTPIQIEQAARTALAGNFFTVDLDSVRAAFEKLPWVRQASARRKWPDGVELELEEHQAVAHWHQRDGESRLVNAQGEVFAAASDRQLPLLAGPEGSAALVLEKFREFQPLLATVGRHAVRLALSPREAWQVRLDDGVVIELGRDEARHPLGERLGRFVAYYRPALARSGLAAASVVDMRYPSGFALRAGQKS